MRVYKERTTPLEGQVCKSCGIQKAASEYSADKTLSSGLRAKCKPCARKASAESYQARKEQHLATNRAYYEKNKEKKAASNRSWYERTQEERRAARREYYAKDPEKAVATNRDWRKKNAHLISSYSAKRRAAAIRRTPAWLQESDFQYISGLYESCKIITALTGVQHHVDHILPLQGKYVSGLHVPSNLQILTASENSKKLNIWRP